MTSPAPPARADDAGRRIHLWRAAAMAAAMLVAAAGAVALKPVPQAEGPAPRLEDGVPGAFGTWRLLPTQAQLAPVSDGTETGMDQPYDQTLMRTYVNAQGQVVMLALAWGRHQRQDVKVHRPEVCYPAQGYLMQGPSTDALLQLPVRAAPVAVRGMVARAGAEDELVRYWIRIGERYGGDGLGTRWYLLRQGLQGHVPDGVLVRASQRVAAGGRPDYAVLDGFLRELTAAIPQPTRAMLVK